MKVYLASIATSIQEIDTKVYETFEKSLKYIYNSLKSLASEQMVDYDFDFFDRDYIQEYFTEDFFVDKFCRVNCRSSYGEFVIEKVKDDKYQFVFSPDTVSSKRINYFIVCELQILELLN
jgi:hypothetical protein